MRIRQAMMVAAALALSGCGGGLPGEIGGACMSGGRDAANRTLCSCIQGVAAQTLSAADQRRAADFFADPQEAQDVKASRSPADDAFWDRYQAFVGRANAQCG